MECPSCKKVFKTKLRCENHIQNCNDNTCFICAKKFSTNSSFKRHLELCKNNISKIQQSIKDIHQEKDKTIADLLQEKDKMINDIQQEKDKTINELRQQLEQERKDFNVQLKLKEQELIIQMKNNEVSLIKQMENKKGSTNKTYNVTINNSFSQSGISGAEIYKDFVDYYTRNPFIVNEHTFDRLCLNSSHILQNITMNDFARGHSTYYDKDLQSHVKDTRMNLLTKKSIDSIKPELGEQMIDYTEKSDTDSLYKDKSKIFINKVIMDKNSNSVLLKEVEGKLLTKLKTIIPNSTSIEKLYAFLTKLINDNILLFIFGSWQDIGFKIANNMKIESNGIIIDDTYYRKIDFVKIIYTILEPLLENWKPLIHAFIFNQTPITSLNILSGHELEKYIFGKLEEEKIYDIFNGIEHSLNY